MQGDRHFKQEVLGCWIVAIELLNADPDSFGLGQLIKPQVKVGDHLRCHRSEHTVKLVRMSTDGFFDVLRQKLKWGER